MSPHPHVPSIETEHLRHARADILELQADVKKLKESDLTQDRLLEALTINVDRLADIAQQLSVDTSRLCGAVDVLTDRPSVIVNTPPVPASAASSLSLENGTWKLRARGMLPMAVVLVVALVALAWAVRHWL